MDFYDLMKKFWAPIVSGIGAITLIVEFIQLYKGDKTVVTWVLVLTGAGLLIAGSAYIAFCKVESPIAAGRKIPCYPRYYKTFQIITLVSILGVVGALVFVLFWPEEEVVNPDNWKVGFVDSCISADMWRPQDGDAFEVDENNCWDLSLWGLSASDGKLVILPGQKNRIQKELIYTQLPNTSKLTFTVKVDHLASKAGNVNLNFGIITQDKNDNRLLFVEKISGEQTYRVVYWEGTGNTTKTLKRYEPGEALEITMLIDETTLKAYLDGHLVINDTVIFGVDNTRFFKIGYLIPLNGEIIAKISDLRIQQP
ncbi:MAG: hypothetical protein MUO62_12060 [Anaerolineales bacterium]|nr:hypothetical protein [Anaerolineales bacterium]